MEQTGAWSVRQTQSQLQRGNTAASMRRSVGAARSQDFLANP